MAKLQQRVYLAVFSIVTKPFLNSKNLRNILHVSKSDLPKRLWEPFPNKRWLLSTKENATTPQLRRL
jgi:hypothetical protein